MLDKSVMIANKAFVLRTNEYQYIYGRASQPQAEQPCTGKQFVCDDFQYYGLAGLVHCKTLARA